MVQLSSRLIIFSNILSKIWKYYFDSLFCRSLPGEPIDVSINESEQVKELVEMGIETLDELDDDDNKRVLNHVINATKKVINNIYIHNMYI